MTVKLHPGDNTGVVESLLQGYPQVRVARDVNSQETIFQSDVVIVASSTTGLEACIADKPLIVAETSGLSEYGPYREYGAALHVSLDWPGAAEHLTDAIRQLASDPETAAKLAKGRRRLIDDVLNGGRGDAAVLTAQAIVELFQGTAESIGTAAASSPADAARQ